MTGFIAKDLKINSWEDIKPYLEKLLDEEITDTNTLENFILKFSDVLGVYREQNARAYINMTCHTDNEDYLKRYEMFNTEIGPKADLILHSIEEKILQHPEYKKLPKERYEQFKLSLEKETKMFRKENVDLDAKLSQLGTKYNQIIGALTVNMNDKEITIPQANVYIKSNDRRLRKEAWSKIIDARYDKKQELDSLFDEMLKLRHQKALNAGFKNYRDFKHEDLHRFDYKPSDVLEFHESIKKYVLPINKQIGDKHRESLGLDKNDYRPWDAAGEPVGKTPLKPFSTSEELLKKAIKVFSKIRPEFGENLIKMKEANLFDLESRKGKAPGGYNYHLEITGMPFIFMNAAGTHSDMTTLMHEGGHAMHSFLTSSEPLINYRHTPSEMAETASMSMELMTSPYWGEFYNDEDLKRARKEHLEDVIQTFPWVAIVDAFQHWVYLNPDHSVEERGRHFSKLMNDFGTGLINWEGYEKYLSSFWHKQLHIFEVPFYYIEYAIAQLGALQIYRNYVNDPKQAINDYIKGLSLGSTVALPKVWEAMNIKFDFSGETVKELMEFVKEELAKLDS